MVTSVTVDTVASYADLCALKPTAEGQRVLLEAWNVGSRVGGGYFVGRLVNRNQIQKWSDGGMVAAGKDYFWEREVANLGKVTVLEFGAVPGGKTDCAVAMTKMHDWTMKNYRGLGIQFPPGVFYVSKFETAKEDSYFRMSGAPAEFGYFASTVIVTDDKEEFLLNLNHRWVELNHIEFRGVSTEAKPNKKGILSNIIIGGQFFNGKSLRFSKIGGTCLKLIDTLDTKLDQWYVSQCTGDVLVNTWSNRDAGGWNHTTAVELTNFNIQNVRGGRVFDMQRCTQALLRNGWIEHCDDPGDISGGGWVMQNFNMEDCKKNLRAANCRLIELGRNIHGATSGIDYTPAPAERWLSEWERGRVDIQPHGIMVDGMLEPGTLGSRNKISNSSDKPVWFCVGNFFLPQEGDSLDINMIGTGNFLSKSACLDDVDGVRQGGGNTLLRLQVHNNAGINGTLMPTGSSPLLAAKVNKTAGGKITVYVQVKPYTRNVIPMITSTSKGRAEAGVSYYFEPVCAAITDTAELTVLSKFADIQEQWSIGRAAGIGVANTGDLILKGKLVNNHLQVQINEGTESNARVVTRFIELKKEAK